MKKIAKIVGALVGVVIVIVGLGATWVSSAANQRMSVTYATHRVEIPVPWPLSEAEIAELTAPSDDPDAPAPTVDLDAIASERAVERGKHLVNARFACVECHGKDFAGGTMIDDPAIGRILGPNLTQGKGSRTAGYTMNDWDRIVRHGVRPDGTPAAMPSEDFVGMSDQELSDIVAYIATMPPVDAEIPPLALGPLGKVLMATGKLPLSAELVHDHKKSHVPMPPATEATPEFGAHLVQICTGCHRADLSGGLHPAAPPGWLPAANLTPTNTRLASWSFEEFDTTMRTGIRPDGTSFGVPMNNLPQYAAQMTDVEMRALFAYLKTLAPMPDTM